MAAGSSRDLSATLRNTPITGSNYANAARRTAGRDDNGHCGPYQRFHFVDNDESRAMRNNIIAGAAERSRGLQVTKSNRRYLTMTLSVGPELRSFLKGPVVVVVLPFFPLFSSRRRAISYNLARDNRTWMP